MSCFWRSAGVSRWRQTAIDGASFAGHIRRDDVGLKCSITTGEKRFRDCTRRSLSLSTVSSRIYLGRRASPSHAQRTYPGLFLAPPMDRAAARAAECSIFESGVRECSRLDALHRRNVRSRRRAFDHNHGHGRLTRNLAIRHGSGRLTVGSRPARSEHARRALDAAWLVHGGKATTASGGLCRKSAGPFFRPESSCAPRACRAWACRGPRRGAMSNRYFRGSEPFQRNRR